MMLILKLNYINQNLHYCQLKYLKKIRKHSFCARIFEKSRPYNEIESKMCDLSRPTGKAKYTIGNLNHTMRLDVLYFA
jgi:hypothetical protein